MASARALCREGEKGLAIYAPMSVRERAEQGEETGEQRTLFRLAHVFDVSQTDSLPGVEPTPLVPPGAEGFGATRTSTGRPGLEQLAGDSGYSLSCMSSPAVRRATATGGSG